MKALLCSILLPLGLAFAVAGHAQVPSGAPAGTTGLCKDGSYTSADAKRGACRGHQGVKEWYTADGAAAKSGTAATNARASAPAAMPAAPAGNPPAGSTGLCKDGSYTDADTKKGACRGHKGVKEWYGASAAAPAKASAPSMPATPAAAPAAPAMPPAAAPARPMTNPAAMPNAGTQDLANRAAAPGGGAGKVWVNTETKVYHCSTDRYYGKTKQGEYMSEADAIAKGAHASHGKGCAQQ